MINPLRLAEKQTGKRIINMNNEIPKRVNQFGNAGGYNVGKNVVNPDDSRAKTVIFPNGVSVKKVTPVSTPGAASPPVVKED